MHINFLSEDKFRFDIALLRERKLNRFVAFFLVFATIVLMVISSIGQTIYITVIQSKGLSMQKEIEKLREQARQQGLAEASLATKGNVYLSVNTRVMWADILEIISRSVSPQVWLNSIKTVVEKDQTSIDITGLSRNQQGVAAFMNSLGTGQHFKDVTLMTSTGLDKEKKEEINFSIRCAYK